MTEFSLDGEESLCAGRDFNGKLKTKLVGVMMRIEEPKSKKRMIPRLSPFKENADEKDF